MFLNYINIDDIAIPAKVTASMNGTISSLLSLPCYPASDLMWTVFYSTPLKGHSTIGPGKWGSLISPGSIPLIVNIDFSSFDCFVSVSVFPCF